MGEFLTAKHSFNSGDLVSLLGGLAKVHSDTGKKWVVYQRLNLPSFYYDEATHPVKGEDGAHVCMNEAMFSMLKPLIEYQSYIERFEIWKGEEVQFDFDLTRQDNRIPLPGGPITQWPVLIFPQLAHDDSLICLEVPSLGAPHGIRIDLSALESEMEGPLISYEEINKIYEQTGVLVMRKSSIKTITKWGCRKKIIINRTERYQNPYITYFFLKDYQDQLVFAGTEKEHDLFCKQWELDIPYLQVNNFLDLAQAISICKFGIFNQSLCFHIAENLKKKRILEVCTSFPNSFPQGGEGFPFVTQNALEYFFQELIKK